MMMMKLRIISLSILLLMSTTPSIHSIRIAHNRLQFFNRQGSSSNSCSLVRPHETTTNNAATVADCNKLSDENNVSSSTRGGARTRGGASQAVSVLLPRTMTTSQMKIFNLLSGGVAGTFAACITNPLEVVKTQLQSSSTSTAAHGGLSSAHGKPQAIIKRIIETDGLPGFFRGLPPTLIGIIPSRSAYFYAYEQTKRAISPIFTEGSVGNAIFSGLAAGVAGNTLTNPIWLVRTRMQLLADATAGQKAYAGYRDAVSTIFREEGIGGFYKGLTASYWGCAEGCVQFVLYEKIKKRIMDRQNQQRAEMGLPPTNNLPKLVYFGSAAMAKCVAAITTYPHEVARTRLREQARNSVFKYNGMWQTLGLIAKEEGRQGLYAGMGMHLLKVVPNSAIMFLTYEIVNTWLGQVTIKDD